MYVTGKFSVIFAEDSIKLDKSEGEYKTKVSVYIVVATVGFTMKSKRKHCEPTIC